MWKSGSPKKACSDACVRSSFRLRTYQCSAHRVYADLGEKLSKGQVVEVAIGGEKTAAIIRSERPGEHGGEQRRYGIEFIKPSDAFLSAVRNITEAYRRDQGEAVSSEQLWLRSG